MLCSCMQSSARDRAGCQQVPGRVLGRSAPQLEGADVPELSEGQCR